MTEPCSCPCHLSDLYDSSECRPCSGSAKIPSKDAVALYQTAEWLERDPIPWSEEDSDPLNDMVQNKMVAEFKYAHRDMLGE